MVGMVDPGANVSVVVHHVWYRQGTDHSCSWHRVNLVSRKSKRLESRVDSLYSCQLHLVLQRETDVGILPCSVEGVTSELD